jgi:hypothetical protein
VKKSNYWDFKNNEEKKNEIERAVSSENAFR